MPLETAKIVETTVLSGTDGQTVRLQIADASLQALPDATVHLVLTAKLPAYRGPMLAHVQREIVDSAHSVLSRLLEELAAEIRSGRADLRPSEKR
jgi:hypothetical protein